MRQVALFVLLGAVPFLISCSGRWAPPYHLGRKGPSHYGPQWGTRSRPFYGHGHTSYWQPVRA